MIRLVIAHWSVLSLECDLKCEFLWQQRSLLFLSELHSRRVMSFSFNLTISASNSFSTDFSNLSLVILPLMWLPLKSCLNCQARNLLQVVAIRTCFMALSMQWNPLECCTFVMCSWLHLRILWCPRNCATFYVSLVQLVLSPVPDFWC